VLWLCSIVAKQKYNILGTLQNSKIMKTKNFKISSHAHVI
jgi:hypothetical protein